MTGTGITLIVCGVALTVLARVFEARPYIKYVCWSAGELLIGGGWLACFHDQPYTIALPVLCLAPAVWYAVLACRSYRDMQQTGRGETSP